MAQQIFSTRPSPQEPKDRHLLSGLVFCGDCGSPMTFVKDGPRTYLVCSASRRYPGSCRTHCIREDQVEQTLLESLRSLCEKVAPKSLYPEFPKIQGAGGKGTAKRQGAAGVLPAHQPGGGKIPGTSSASFRLLRTLAAEG